MAGRLLFLPRLGHGGCFPPKTATCPCRSQHKDQSVRSVGSSPTRNSAHGTLLRRSRVYQASRAVAQYMYRWRALDPRAAFQFITFNLVATTCAYEIHVGYLEVSWNCFHSSNALSPAPSIGVDAIRKLFHRGSSFSLLVRHEKQAT